MMMMADDDDDYGDDDHYDHGDHQDDCWHSGLGSGHRRRWGRSVRYKDREWPPTPPTVDQLVMQR